MTTLYRSALVVTALLALLAAGPASAAEEPLPGEAPSKVVARVWTRDLGLVAALARSTDLWTYDPRQGYALVLVSAEEYEALVRSGWAIDLDYERTERFARPIEPLPGQRAGISGFPCYRTVEETYASLSGLAAAHPGIASWVDIGDTWNKAVGPGPGYDLFALVLSNPAVPGPKFPFILIAAIHAREYATAEIATRFAEELVAGYGTNPDATWILDHGEIHIIAQLNPDGRKRAEAGQSWRKNVDNNFCADTNNRGIDLNRNSTVFWGGSFSSGSACNETFRGPTPASEPETAAIEAYMAQVLDDQRGPAMGDAAPDTATGLFISLHSFGELVLFPWEGASTPSPNDSGLASLGRKFGFANGYLACQDSLPPASGTTVDVAYGVYGVSAYTFEVGNNFFESCTSFQNTILPNNLAALRYAVKAARRPYQEPKGPEVLNALVSAPLVEPGDPVTLTATANDTRYASNGCGTEPTQTIAGAGYTVDTPPWNGVPLPMAAADGSFNAGVEGLTAVLDTSTLAPGRHLIYVVAEDALGNRGVPTAVFLEVSLGAEIFSDGFETGDTSAWALVVP